MTTQKQYKSNLHHALRVQCALRLNSGVGTPQSCAKRYSITPEMAVKYQEQFNKGILLNRKKQWSPHWDKPEVIPHPLDTDIVVDILNGCPKHEDALIGMFDQEFDGVNGVYHITWDDNDILALCEGISYRILQILRDSKRGSELYLEAVEWLKSDFFKLICKTFGIDHDVLINESLRITQTDFDKPLLVTTPDVDKSIADLLIDGSTQNTNDKLTEEFVELDVLADAEQLDYRLELGIDVPEQSSHIPH